MIYCDYQATTPLAPEAREAMLPWLGGPDSEGFGNPHSPHRMGRQAAAIVDFARSQVTQLLPPGGRVVFTSGATEAINLAIRGSGADGRPVAVSAIEHAAVLDTAQATGPVSLFPVDSEGIVQTSADLPSNVRLVALMQVNNEIGTIQPCEAMFERAKSMGALTLCDAVQGAGKLAPPEGADLIAISAHKLYGPKGIGALWIRDGVALDPVMTGGGQEQGLRSGTLSPALCAGFGAAAQLAADRMEADRKHVDSLWKNLLATLGNKWTINGSADRRWRGNLNVWRKGLDVARLMSDCRQIAFSAGSACASGSGRPSHVLKAIGLADKDAKSAIRLGFGRYTKVGDLEATAAAINAAAQAQE